MWRLQGRLPPLTPGALPALPPRHPIVPPSLPSSLPRGAEPATDVMPVCLACVRAALLFYDMQYKVELTITDRPRVPQFTFGGIMISRLLKFSSYA